MRLLAVAALVLAQGTAVDDYRGVGVHRPVRRLAARIVGRARRPLPRKRVRDLGWTAVQLVPRMCPLCSPTVSPRRGRVEYGEAAQSIVGKMERPTARRRGRPGGHSRHDEAAARAIVRDTARLRRRRKPADMVDVERPPSDAIVDLEAEAKNVRVCSVSELCGAVLARSEQSCMRAVPSNSVPVDAKKAIRGRRPELAWLKRMAGRLVRRSGRSSEVARAVGRARRSRRPALQWSSPPASACAQASWPRRVAVLPPGPLRVLAVTATVAGAAFVDYGFCDVRGVGHQAAYHSMVCDAAGWSESGIRYGEARHPGPATTYDDPEAFGDDEGQELAWLALSEADGVVAAGIGVVESSSQELQGHVGPEHMDLLGAAVDIDKEYEGGGGARAWWDIKLGEECGSGSSLDIECASQEHLLAAAFPPPDGRQGDHAANEQYGGDDLFDGHMGEHRGPQVEEITVHPPAGSGVPLPLGLFRSLQEEDARRAELAAERWRRLRQQRAEGRAAVAAGRERARAGEVGTNRAAGMQAHNVPREPSIEEVQGLTVMEMQPEDDLRGLGDAPARRTPSGSGDVGAGRVYARRARGRRQRGCQEGELWLLNSSGKPQLEAAVCCANESGGKCIAILNQEHHQGAARLADLQATAKAHGWTAAAAAAVVSGDGGPSAGVAVLTPSHVSSGLGVGGRVDISPKGSEGRLAQLWCQRVVPSGLLCISMYLHTNEGATPRNVALVSKALCTAVASGCPWVIAGDMQDSPDAFLRWAGAMLRRAGGRIVASVEPTHYPGRGEAKVLDFFIVADVVAPFVKEAKVLQQVVASPHRAVALAFRRVGPPPLHWQRRAPRPFPRVPPVGCARAPVAPRLDEIDGTEQLMAEAVTGAAAGAADAGTSGGAIGDRESYVTRAWGKLADAIEAELCGRADRHEGESPDRRWCGRAEGPRYVQGPALPPRAAGAWGTMDMSTHAMAWTGNRVSELMNLSIIARGRLRELGQLAGSTGLSDGQLKQWHRIVSKVLGCRSPMSRFLSGVQWDQLRLELRRVRTEPALAMELLTGTSAWIRQRVQEQRRANASGKLRGWRAWIARQLKDGGSAIHKFAKRVEEAPEELLIVRGSPSADPQDMVNKDFDDWGAIWRKLQRHASAPWREADFDGPSELPRPTHVELREAAATFSPWTGTSSELLTPRHYTWLSDLLLGRIGA